MEKTKRVIIAGGTGFLGKVLSNYLTEHHYEVTVLTRNPQNAKSLFNETINIRQWDARSAHGWEEVADGAFAIINLA